MRITALSPQARNPDRVNVSIDGEYRLSLDITQVVDLEVKVGKELTAEDLSLLERESEFGKLYTQALEYSLIRPRSVREMDGYLRRKTLTRHYKSRKTGRVREIPGVSQAVAKRVLARLQEKDYVDDEKFAHWWVESRHLRKGASRRKLYAELQSKGVPGDIIQRAIDDSGRTDGDELAVMIAKKHNRYAHDPQKFMQYLIRQGFSYNDVKSALDDIL